MKTKTIINIIAELVETTEHLLEFVPEDVRLAADGKFVQRATDRNIALNAARDAIMKARAKFDF